MFVFLCLSVFFFSFPEILFFQDKLIQDVMLNVLFCYARTHAKLIYRQVHFVCFQFILFRSCHFYLLQEIL